MPRLCATQILKALALQRLADLNLDPSKPIAAATKTGLPRDAIRRLIAGIEPKLNRAEEISDALGLELYIGPPRGDPPPGESHSSRPSNYVISLAPAPDEEAVIAALRAAGVEIRRRRGGV